MSLTETSSWLTIGIEEEFQIVDADGELRAHIDELLEAATPLMGEAVKAEFLQSSVEIGTKICADTREARDEVYRMRGTLADLLSRHDLRLASAGTHPFSHWQDQRITVGRALQDARGRDAVGHPRAADLRPARPRGDPRRRPPRRDHERGPVLPPPHPRAVDVLAVLARAGHRPEVVPQRGLVAFPRTGIPPEFSSFDEFENYCQLLLKTNSIEDGKKIWWDLRPHHLYPTLEFRVCDAATRVDETICIAALVQAICAKLIRLRRANMGFRKYLPNLIAENKWRAMRHGVEGRLIDFGKQAEVPMRDLALELLEFVDDVVDELGSRADVEYVHTILSEGTSADRQLRVFRETGDLRKVVDHVASETVTAPVE